jgi:hypothetical protein
MFSPCMYDPALACPFLCCYFTQEDNPMTPRNYCLKCFETLSILMCVKYGSKQLFEGGRLLKLERELTGHPCPVHGWLPGSAQSGTNEQCCKSDFPPPSDEEGEDQEKK